MTTTAGLTLRKTCPTLWASTGRAGPTKTRPSKGRQAIVDLHGRVSRCRENRWIWELLADRMVFIGAYGAERVATPRPPRQRGSTPEEAMYAAVTDAHRLSVRIRPTPCVDTMSGDRYASTVEVGLDGAVYRGCGDVLQPGR
ncbi:MAG TPA: hypothetical protein VFR64_22900 [Methylomirabilota bacterium]|nr:hypothetical protein [Methylomirabilota bacterium]